MIENHREMKNILDQMLIYQKKSMDIEMNKKIENIINDYADLQKK